MSCLLRSSWRGRVASLAANFVLVTLILAIVLPESSVAGRNFGMLNAVDGSTSIDGSPSAVQIGERCLVRARPTCAAVERFVTLRPGEAVRLTIPIGFDADLTAGVKITTTVEALAEECVSTTGKVYAPELGVSVDGVTMGSRAVSTSKGWTPMRFHQGTLLSPLSQHTIDVARIDDSSASCIPNLHVDRVFLNEFSD